ncbi:hypothetical protein KGP36_02345 [Patescibacteria group bacterium]|nr:hypothetical protein [Patescibacteria group bacterium]
MLAAFKEGLLVGCACVGCAVAIGGLFIGILAVGVLLDDWKDRRRWMRHTQPPKN